jgi:carbamoyltransferase
MEFGARALGCRSILADPTRPEMTEIVNRWVKHREDFRPFAPSVHAHRSSEFFKDIDSSPFMSFVSKVTPKAEKEIPAVVHVDGSARLQTLEKDVNPLYWSLLEEFEKVKGVPVVLNTSFNVKGEPIVCAPRDAIRCFYSTGIDVLSVGSFMLEKPGVAAASRAS